MTGRLDLALVQLSNYLERDLETRSRINQALAYPVGRARMALVTVGDARRSGCCRSSRSSSTGSARSCRSRPGSSSGSRTSRRRSGGSSDSSRSRVRRMSGSICGGPRAAVASATGSTLRAAAGQGDRPLLRRRACHPHPRCDVACRRAAARRDGRGDPRREQLRLRRRACRDAQVAHARRRGARRARSATPACSPRPRSR